ncbi:hypothetical protein C7M84_025011 [Penaeus vannamei]|uniref:CBM21 domain-containing protein n=1 Tax=Penaeus vannamei TaxID=6689 RepID=A0A423TZF6_PENVA|nr:hypothetical protein C7M84_025011 [Penaeus vannamei]
MNEHTPPTTTRSNPPTDHGFVLVSPPGDGGAQAEALADQWSSPSASRPRTTLGMKARRNLSYHKQVKVRYTTSNWLAHDDVYADYVPSAATATGASYDLYDTFTFALPLPSSNQADKLEFCVCYTCSDAEFWTTTTT